MKLSDRIGSIEGSKTVAFTALIPQLRQEGRKIIDLSIGEPEFDTPTPVIDATQKALDTQKTRYGPVNGLSELRTRLAARLLKQAGVAVVPGEAFGMATHLRISFAVSEENLNNGLDAIAEVL